MSFDILQPYVDVRCSRLIEASAGTGKTFAIQHLVTRLLLSDPLIPYERMALITFTKKATQSLKERLRQTLQEACTQVRSGLMSWPYLQTAVDAKGHEFILKRILECLFHFDAVRVNTIHAFAYGLLNHLNLLQGRTLQDRLTQPDYLLQLIRSHLRLLDQKTQSEIGIIELVRDGYSWDLEKLSEDISYALQKGLKIGLDEIVDTSLGQCLPLLDDPIAPKVYELALEFAKDFKGTCNREGQPYFDTFLYLRAWQKCIELKHWSELDRVIELINMFQPGNLKKGKHNPLAEYFSRWRPYLSLLKSCKSKRMRLESLARHLSKSLESILEEDERVGFDVILRKLVKLLDNDVIAYQLAHEFDVVIVDEFQDTDPMQWQILKRLYLLNPKLSLILVGDPKQSIYAFRQADIYTYLEAKKLLEQPGRSSQFNQLSTNFRSHPKLIQALNVLFDTTKIGHWLALPRVKQSLHCPNVQAGRQDPPCDRERVEFFTVGATKSQQVDHAAAFIANKMEALQSQGLTSFAALVSDHRSAQLLQAKLQAQGVSCQIQRPRPFSALMSAHLYYIALSAWLEPNDEERMRAFWSNPIFELNQQKIEELFNLDAHPFLNFWQHVQICASLLKDKGIEVFHEVWLGSPVPFKSSCLRSYLLQFQNGYNLLMEWAELVSWISSKLKSGLSYGAAAKNLLEKVLAGEHDDEAVYIAPTTSQSVQIVTIHASKGLEYDVVFSIGTVSSSHAEGGWLPVYTGHEHRLVSFDGNSHEHHYLQACDEQDAEKARLLYVAWTRAKEYLFIAMPSFLTKRRGGFKRGLSSPMDLYMAAWSEPNTSEYESLYSVMNEGKWHPFLQKIEQWQKDKLISFQPQPFILDPPLEGPSTLFKQSFSWPLMDLSQRLIPAADDLNKVSFTALAQKSYEVSLHRQLFDDLINLDPLFTMPAGKSVGIVWHGLMQQMVHLIRFGKDQSVWGSQLLSWLRQRAPKELEPWYERLIEQTCLLAHTKWQVISHQLQISSLSSSQLWAEKTFSLSPSIARQYLGSETAHIPQPWLHGVIDLIIFIENRVYFIDWKSNWLGNKACSYSPQRLLENALSNSYDLQAKIYSQALKSYIDMYADGKWQLAGGLYIYMRSRSCLYWCCERQLFMELEDK